MHIAEQKEYQLIIVGAGPAGLSAAARAHSNQFSYLVLERDTIARMVKKLI